MNLRKIIINPDALILIERILASCIDMDKTVDDIRFPKDQPISLEDLRCRFPIPAVGFYQICKANGSSKIKPENVVQLFAGPIHAIAVKDRLENPHQIIVATGQPFLARMKEVNIHFSIPENRAVFGLFDLAMPARVKNPHGQKTQLSIWDLTVTDVVSPSAIQLKQDQWVLTHMGAVITVIRESEVKKIRRLQKQSAAVEMISDFMTTLKGKEINCSNFCPSGPNKNDGCDLSTWNIERL